MKPASGAPRFRLPEQFRCCSQTLSFASVFVLALTRGKSQMYPAIGQMLSTKVGPILNEKLAPKQLCCREDAGVKMQSDEEINPGLIFLRWPGVIAARGQDNLTAPLPALKFCLAAALDAVRWTTFIIRAETKEIPEH